MPALKTVNQLTFTPSKYAGTAAIYVHWPFCLKKCPYCDFNSHVRETVSQKEWRSALVREIETAAANFPNLKAKSIFFGGGTPSLMPPETVSAAIEAIHKYWAPNGDIEVTLEANPSSVEAGRFQGYRQAGVNRLSVGIQSLDDRVLKFLGRLHSAEEALAALKVAQDNFERVSFDLIYARPEQTLSDWKKELTEALGFGTSHMSLYQLTIEEGTAFFHQFRRGKFSLPDEDAAAALYDLTLDLTSSKGLNAYEVSNHAIPGQESQHNLAYWQGDYYVGIGPGAHGRLPAQKPGDAYAHAQIKRPEDWLAAVVSRGTGLQSLDYIPSDERAGEAILTGLRLTEGVDVVHWGKLFGQKLYDVIDKNQMETMIASGHMEKTTSHIRLTHKGMPLLNFILGKLLA